MSGDRGPVAPLYLNLEEVTQLEVAIGLLFRLSHHMVSDDAQALAGLILEWKEGPGAVSRLDQTLAHARDRLPILRSLATALAELTTELQRSGGDDDDAQHGSGDGGP